MLAADDGAKIRQSLSARAATLRRRELADAEGEAGEQSQSMLVAQLLICMGFLIFSPTRPSPSCASVTTHRNREQLPSSLRGAGDRRNAMLVMVGVLWDVAAPVEPGATQ